jgi:hypothetical protein
VAKFLTGFGCSAAADKVEGESQILEDMYVCMDEYGSMLVD